MTDDEALDILAKCDGWICWRNRFEDGVDVPDWLGSHIALDGSFTANELRAILHFAPQEEPCAGSSGS